ncbi:hypothetical protein ACIO52_32050 [Nocardia sp. NPDC087230]|uniref:hypothetical protein n=1 Tax=Nocardia sp. NPDC087230 TaxID=3364331 RepID=UPI003802E81B
MVKDCPADPVTGKNLDPHKKLGWSSYPYEVFLCVDHATAIDAGDAWVCHDAEGVSGWQVLINDQVKDLNKFVVTNADARITQGPMSRLDSGVLPRGAMVTFAAQHVGSRDPSSTVELHLDAAQARKIAEQLLAFAELEG